MPWYLYLALKQLFPSGKRISFSTAVSIGGVLLGVMLLIIVLSVMNGFGNELRSKTVDVSGHIRVEAEGLMSSPDPTLKTIRAMPEVQAASAYAQGVVMLQYQNKPQFPFIRSIDVDPANAVIPIQKFLLVGKMDDLDDDSVFLSSELAYSLAAQVGSKVDIYSPLLLDKLKKDEVLLPRSLRIAGIFQTGWNQVDANTVICTLRLMQDLYGLGHSVHGIAVRLKNGDDTDKVVQKLTEVLPQNLHAISWRESSRDFLFVLNLEHNVMFFLLIFIELVAAFAIASSLVIAVVRKTREIGLIAALGGKPREVAALFCFQGLLIGLTGTLLGVVSAAVILHYRDNIIHSFAHVTRSEAALVQYYQFSSVPASYSAYDMTLVITSSIIISTLAGLLPAWRAAKLKPVEALRSE